MGARAWTWLDVAVVEAAHAEQLAEHGGPSGLRDRALLESALARPRQLVSYGTPDAAALAAAYAFALARNHPFVDGNKRMALVAMELFLEINDCRLDADDAECVAAMTGLASGRIDEQALAQWVRQRLRKGLVGQTRRTGPG